MATLRGVSTSDGLKPTGLRVSEPEITARELAVVIPTRDRWETIAVTLEALEHQTERGFEVIIVVDGRDQVVPQLDRVKIIQQDHAGPGAARNSGVQATDR